MTATAESVQPQAREGMRLIDSEPHAQAATQDRPAGRDRDAERCRVQGRSVRPTPADKKNIENIFFAAA